MEKSSKKRIITIAGRPGSGKSTAAKAVAAKLGFKHFSSGDLYRQLAHEQGIELLQANISAKAHQLIDPLVDGRLQQIGAKDDRLVIDSRIAWHWIPGSFKVFLDLDLEIAAQRILNEASEYRLKNEEVANDPKHYADALKRRLDEEKNRYQLKYKINTFDMSNYDLVIDTAKNDAEQVVEMILKGFEEWTNK
jgi:CMP/dCMP kinase